MIQELRIRDLGVIADAVLPLGPGLTAVTGETGAGKTMVVTALGLLLGERADPQVVRAGAETAAVEGSWRLRDEGRVRDMVEAAGGFVEDDELLLARTVAREGRSRALVGGRSAPAAILQELGERLVVVHGQSEQIRLASHAAQRAALDRFAGPELAEVLQRLGDAYLGWRRAASRLAELEEHRDARQAEAAALRETIEWIESIAPVPGEEAALTAETSRLEHLEALRQAAAQAHELLRGDERGDEGGDTAGSLGQVQRLLDRVAAHDPALPELAAAAAELRYGVEDLALRLAGYLDGLGAEDQGRLDAAQTRLAALAELRRRHGPTVEDGLALLDSGSARLLELDGDDEAIPGLTEEVAARLTESTALAERATALRRAAASRLAEAVTAELAALAMPTARLLVEVTPTDRLSAHGLDEVAFLLAPHPGAEPRPIGKGASGGELSRIMLALEVVIAEVDPVPTFVFDEVDAGIGGAAAIEVGRRLAALADHAQVIVVTHLAQVAAFADRHLRIRKDTAGAFTVSSVAALDDEERVREMARLLSGMPDSAAAQASAEELLGLRR